MSNVIITLAHHLNAEDAEKLGLPKNDLNPLTEIVVPEDVARGLIGAGYAQVETERPEQVAKALRRHAPKDHKVGLYVAPEEVTAADDGKTADTEPKTNAEPSEGTQAAPKRGSGK
jgi:hypothetical protein